MLCTVAFNNPYVISLQIKQLKKNLKDNFCLVVIDNSTRIIEATKIRLTCMKERVLYSKVPFNSHSGVDPSMSHGFALNFAYKSFCNKSEHNYFGFMDHDIFPTQEYSIINKLKRQEIYGLKQVRNKKWYLWPGFCYFKSSINSCSIDFMPSKDTDTGGGNWDGVYSKLNPASIKFPDYTIKTIGSGNNKQEDKYEIIDNSWLHLVNASNWANVNMNQKFSNLDILLYELADK